MGRHRRRARAALLPLVGGLTALGCEPDGLERAPAQPELATECALQAQVASPASARARNVVLFVTDDQGYDLSHPAVARRGLATPNMDALASRGMFFTRAFAAAAVSSASRAAILTGLQPHSNGQWCNTNGIALSDPDVEFTRQTSQFDGRIRVHDDVTTLVEILSRAGYYTAITQKLHVAPPWKFPFASRKGYASRTPESFERAVAELLDESEGRPFFLMANVGHPHRPFDPEQAGASAGDPDSVEIPGWLPDTAEVRLDRAE